MITWKEYQEMKSKLLEHLKPETETGMALVNTLAVKFLFHKLKK